MVDITQEIEIRILCGAKKRIIDPRDYLFEDLVKKKAMPPLPIRASTKDGFPAVYCQHYGDCTANAALAADDYYYHAPKGGKWVPSTVFTYYNSKADDHDLIEDDGSTVERALKEVRKRGACNSKVWPNTMPWNEKPSPKAYANGLKGKEITTFHRIKNMTELKRAIASGYPVPGCVQWAFTSIDENYILNNPTKKDIKTIDSWHAIVFVGYDDETQLVEIRNSWGDGWGNEGYGFITYAAFGMVIDYSDTYAVVK